MMANDDMMASNTPEVSQDSDLEQPEQNDMDNTVTFDRDSYFYAVPIYNVDLDDLDDADDASSGN